MNHTLEENQNSMQDKIAFLTLLFSNKIAKENTDKVIGNRRHWEKVGRLKIKEKRESQ